MYPHTHTHHLEKGAKQEFEIDGSPARFNPPTDWSMCKVLINLNVLPSDKANALNLLQFSSLRNGFPIPPV